VLFTFILPCPVRHIFVLILQQMGRRPDYLLNRRAQFLKLADAYHMKLADPAEEEPRQLVIA
jgi:hypothetical protein